MHASTFTREQLETVIKLTREQYASAVKLQYEAKILVLHIQMEALVRLSESPVDHDGVYDLTTV